MGKDWKNARFCQQLTGWSRICDDIRIWNYNTNFRNYLLPFPNLRVIGPNIRFFADNNVRGVFMQAAGNTMGAELSDLRNYMMARLLWNPDLSGEELMNEFLDLHYKKAAAPIRRFINLTHDTAEFKGVNQGCFGHAKDYGLDDAVARAGIEAFDEALRLADDDTIRARVEKASICAYRLAIEDVWWIVHITKISKKSYHGDFNLKVTPELAARTRPYARRLFELCDKYGVTHWAETLGCGEAKQHLRAAFGLKEGESF